MATALIPSGIFFFPPLPSIFHIISLRAWWQYASLKQAPSLPFCSFRFLPFLLLFILFYLFFFCRTPLVLFLFLFFLPPLDWGEALSISGHANFRASQPEPLTSFIPWWFLLFDIFAFLHIDFPCPSSQRGDLEHRSYMFIILLLQHS